MAFMGKMATLVPHFPTYPDLVEDGEAYVDLEAAERWRKWAT